MASRVLCPSLPDLLRKTILTFCEGSVMFRSSLEVIGSLHIRSDNEKVTTFILDEKVIRPFSTDQVVDGACPTENKQSESDSGGVSPVRKGRKISKPIKKIRYPEIYISSDVESENESVYTDNPSMNHVSQGQFGNPPTLQPVQDLKQDVTGAQIQVDGLESSGSMSSDDVYAAREVEQRRMSGNSVEEVTSTGGTQGLQDQNGENPPQEYWMDTSQYEPGQLPTNTTNTPVVVTVPAPEEDNTRLTPCSQESGSSVLQSPVTNQQAQIKSEVASPPIMQQNPTVSEAPANSTDIIHIPQYSNITPEIQIQMGELQNHFCVSQPGGKPFLLSPTVAGITWPQVSPLLNVTPQAISPNLMLPFTSPPLPQLPQINQINGNIVPSEAQIDTSLTLQTQDPSNGDKNISGGKVCGECGKTLKSDRMLALHMNAAHTHKETFPCQICGRVFYAASSLHSHKKRLHSSNAEKHPCPKCNKLFAFNSELSRHMQLMHGQSSLSQVHRNVEPISASSGLTHKCMECGKQLRSKECLILHINAKHTQKLRYPCKVCGKVFYAPSSRFCHMKRSHTSLEQKFRCHHCGKLFVFHYLLRNHLQIAHNDYSVLTFSGSNGTGSENEYTSLNGNGGDSPEEQQIVDESQTEDNSPHPSGQVSPLPEPSGQ